jgi:hypothetical protein
MLLFRPKPRSDANHSSQRCRPPAWTSLRLTPESLRAIHPLIAVERTQGNAKPYSKRNQLLHRARTFPR